jgi:hypothetical protein
MKAKSPQGEPLAHPQGARKSSRGTLAPRATLRREGGAPASSKSTTEDRAGSSSPWTSSLVTVARMLHNAADVVQVLLDSYQLTQVAYCTLWATTG